MTPSINASSKVRYITIDLHNSCNCCCFDRLWNRQNSQTQLYVNSMGVAERYDPKKAVDPQAALERAVDNLNRVIEYNAKLAQKEPEYMNSKIVEVVVGPLDEKAIGNPFDEVDANPAAGVSIRFSKTTSWPITMDLIKKVNTVMKKVVEDSPSVTSRNPHPV